MQQGWKSTSRGASKLPSNEFDFAWLKIIDEASGNVQTDDTDVTSTEAKVIKLETPLRGRSELQSRPSARHSKAL
jgi:hypothetical protein